MQDETGSEQEVRPILDRWLQATMSADADTLDSILADGFTYTHATTAGVDTREEWLESFRSGGRRYHTYEVADLDARPFPGVLVLAGRSHQEMGPDDARRELNARFTSLWVKQEPGWRLAYWQATRIPPE